MGFASIISAAGALASGAVQASSQRQQSEAYREAAENQWKIANQTAEQITETALENQRRSHRNANMQLAEAQADAAASNLMREGSVILRETDLATRLEDEISNRTNAALQEANELRRQAAYDRRNLLLHAGTARSNSRVSLLSGAVGALGALASGSSQGH